MFLDIIGMTCGEKTVAHYQQDASNVLYNNYLYTVFTVYTFILGLIKIKPLALLAV